VEHHTTVHEVGEGRAQAVKTAGTMDSLQSAADAGDLHQWEISLR
jgi:hypothetical protein